MKITPKILSLPPYLSTSWENISSFYVREEGGAFRLIVLLQNHVQVEVPGLDKALVDAIFEAHAKHAESERKNPFEGPFSFSVPLVKGEGSLDSLALAMQHNPEQANMPPFPPEVLEKIVAVARAFGVEDLSPFPKPEPHCNCIYCQFTRAFQGKEEETVSDSDLKFRNWEIEQKGEKLYLVTNPLDKEEHYNVFLGEPLGCTCGHKNCEHICAVLNS